MFKIFKKTFLFFLILILLFFCLGHIHALNAVDVNNLTSDFENASVKTYTDLYDKINSSEDNSIVELNESYMFSPYLDDESFIDGVKISKNLTLIGKNDAFIDGNHLATGLNISSGCHVVLKNIIFKNGYSKTSSGAILVSPNANLLVENCTFKDNGAYDSNGGAIYGLEGTNIEIHGCDFDNNTAAHLSTLPWDQFKSGMGSAICMRIGSNLKLYDSIFRNNNAYVTTILIITWDDVNTNQSTLYVENCLFENNVAYSNCAIYLDEFGIGEIINSVFRHNNSTDLGGTIVFDASKHAVVRNCTFEENSAVEGGGVYINTFDAKYHSTVEIYDSTFTKNTVKRLGGGMLSIRSTTLVENCKFDDNVAALNGGGVYAKFGSIKINNCEFARNSAEYGGAILLNDDESQITKSTFVKNVASKTGGGVYSNRGSVKINESNFKENHAEYGGAALLNNDENIISMCSFVNNAASKNGGAIYSNKGAVKISDSTFNENHGQYGGALFLNANENVINNSVLFKNHASKNGGAVYSNKGAVQITDSKFDENSAKYGGALLLKADKNIVKSSSFVKNTASKSGGAIYSTSKSVSSSGCSYSKNSAPKNSKVYGVFHAKVTKYVDASGKVKLKIILSSPWKMSISQKIKIKLKKFTSKWLKTNSKGKYVFTVPKDKNVNKKTVSIVMNQGFCIIKKYTYKNPGKITVPKTVKKVSNLKVTVKNSLTKKAIKKTYFKVKIYTNKKYKIFKVKSNSKGVLKVNMSEFSKGNHKISIYLNNNNYYINKKLSFKVN